MRTGFKNALKLSFHLGHIQLSLVKISIMYFPQYTIIKTDISCKLIYFSSIAKQTISVM